MKRLFLQNPMLILAAGFLVLTIGFGIRASFGLFIPSITADTGWSVAFISFAFAVQNLMWGASQPFAGALADTRGGAVVVAGGVVLYLGGLGLMAWGGDPWIFGIGTGVLIGFGQAALGFPVILGVIGRSAPPERRSLYLGIATAGASFGQFLFAPIGRTLIDSFGWADALVAMGAICLLAAVIGLVLGPASNRQNATAESADPGLNLKETLHYAARHKGFVLLTAGFFVCGFQLAFILVHLPLFVVVCGLPASVGATGIALIGMFNVIGTIGAGQLGGMYKPKNPLALIYFGRTLAALALVLFPVTETTILVFSAVMGVLWLSTVPLTSNVIARIFGPRYVGTLFGIVFFSHQVGSFLGIWIAGEVYEATGSYDLIWYLSAALGLFAALVHLPIDDRRITVTRPAAAE